MHDLIVKHHLRAIYLNADYLFNRYDPPYKPSNCEEVVEYSLAFKISRRFLGAKLPTIYG